MPDERKLVTILFADTCESTSLGESLDPEDVRTLMGRYYEHAQRIVSDYGGTVEKFIGDAVMAVFGLPQAHSNDAERALAAAQALRAAISQDSVLDGRLVLRIGVNTGNVVAASDTRRGDFLVTGDAVNVAARLEQAASPDEILAGERTAAAAEATFLFGEGRSLSVKGKSQPLHVFPLSGPRAGRPRTLSPLVGRKPDLARLALLRDQALTSRRPQLVSLIAPAGTGKTRLLDEFLAGLDPKDGFRVATAHCSPYGQTLTYWPLRGLLEELFTPDFKLGDVVDAFTRGGLPREDAVRLSGLVLAALGVGREDMVERETIWSAWQRLLGVLAAQAPRIIVFEDLHWASESLLDLVEYLMQPRIPAPLLIVATSRPELMDRRPTWGAGWQSFSTVALRPLRSAQTRTLVNKLQKQLPEATRRQIVERSGGNPFFAIELTRALINRSLAGSVAPSEAHEAPSETLPDTVQEVLQERLDLLSTCERTVLQMASVVGSEFRAATLKTMIGPAGSPEVDPALEGLLAHDLIAPARGGAYTFRHVLIRDVAGSTLSRAERVRLHAAVSAWLEEFAAGRLDEFVELIAYHARESVLLARQAAVPLDVPVDCSRAVRFLARAGEVDSRAGAFAESEHYLRSAIELAPVAEHQRLYELLGDCLIMGDTCLAAYRQALASWHADTARLPLVGARLLRKLLTLLMRWWGSLTERPRREEMVALLSEARILAAAAGDDYEWWRLCTAELFWPTWSGERAAEDAPAQMAIGLAAADYFEARGDWPAFNEALDAYADCASDLRMYAAAAHARRRRLRTPGLSSHERSDVLAALVSGQTEAGDYAGAVETMRAAIAERRGSALAGALGHAASWASFAAYLSGCWSEIAAFVAAMDEAWGESRHDPGLVTLHWGYAVALQTALACEDQEAAERAAAALRRLATGTAKHRSHWLLSLVEASLRDDPTPLQADASIITGLDQYWAVHAPIIMFLSERGLPLPPTLRNLFSAGTELRYIDYLHHCTQIAEALATPDDERLKAAILDAETHGLSAHAARMRIVVAQRTGDLSQLDLARPVLERLGDVKFLRRLAGVAAELQ